MWPVFVIIFGQSMAKLEPSRLFKTSIDGMFFCVWIENFLTFNLSSVSAVPIYPGLRRFPNGRNVKQWTGDVSKALIKVTILPQAQYRFRCSCSTGISFSKYRPCTTRDGPMHLCFHGTLWPLLSKCNNKCRSGSYPVWARTPSNASQYFLLKLVFALTSPLLDNMLFSIIFAPSCFLAPQMASAPRLQNQSIL